MIDARAWREAVIGAIEWQRAMGADEAIADHPFDRAGENHAGELPLDRGEGEGTRKASRPLQAGADPPAPPLRSAAPPPPAPAAFPQTQALPEAEEARTIADACHTLDALAQALAAFEGSPLRAGARNCVFSDGSPEARVMFIGEAPGREEDRLGLPFVGRSGRLLDRMLGAIGLDRKTKDPAKAAYISNIVPWRPAGNRTPSPTEVLPFMPFVLRHIALADPEIIVPLGGVAAKALLEESTGIMRLRGVWREIVTPAAEPSGEPVTRAAIATFHPAYLLRSPAAKKNAWQDFLAIRRRLDESS